MDTSKIEDLLVEVVEKLDELIHEVREINGELNWIKEHSFAKKVTDMLYDIEGEIRNLK